MKKRNPVAVFLLSILTFGIYDIYWLVKTKSALNRSTSVRVPSIWLLFSPIVFFILSIPLFFVIPSSGAAGAIGATALIIMLQMVIWLAILPISFYWFFKYSKAVHEYTRGAMSTGLAFIMLWLLHVIGVALVQDAFNDTLDHAMPTGQPQGNGGYMPPQPFTAAQNPGHMMHQPSAPHQSMSTPSSHITGAKPPQPTQQQSAHAPEQRTPEQGSPAQHHTNQW